MTSRSLTPARGSRTPLWLTEGLDVVQRRAAPLRLVVAAVCLLGLALAFFAPGIVPPTWQVGAAVAVAALLLGLAVAIAVDTADLTLRGPRHVRAAGGELVAVVPTLAAPPDLDALAAAVLDARAEGGKLILGLSAAGRDARRVATVTDTLAVALARHEVSVLRLDLASGREERDGLFEVLREGRRLGVAVDFEPGGLNLARLGAGRDVAGALEALPDLPARLPRDLDVLVVALPTAASRPSVQAAAALDHVLIVAERDTTSRVDLIAGLDALESVGIAAQVVLVDDVTAGRVVPAAPAAAVAEPDAPAAAVPEPDGPAASVSGPDAPEASISEPAAPAATVPEPIEPIVPDPDSAPYEPEPDPAPYEPEPDPAPYEPEPDPAPYEPEPMPDPVASQPAAPVPVVPDPAPAEPDPEPYVPDPDPAPYEPEPDPAPYEPEPMPDPVASQPVAPEPVVPDPAPAEPDPEPEPHVPDPTRPSSETEPPDVNLRPIPGATTRIRRIEPVHPFDPDDDPLRTTAQLAVLIDDLEARDER